MFQILPKNERKISALVSYSRFRNKHSPRLINFLTFFQGLRPYSGIHRVYLSNISIRYKWGYAYSFCQNFQGLRLFKGVRLFRTLEYDSTCVDLKKKVSENDYHSIKGYPIYMGPKSYKHENLFLYLNCPSTYCEKKF